jgi:predicted NodU family carbamoyl transferase
MLDGKVVGWFQGAMEFGAEHWAIALCSLIHAAPTCGISSICGSSFGKNSGRLLPSILEEHVGEWFEINEATPYMEKVFPIRKEKAFNHSRGDSCGRQRPFADSVKENQSIVSQVDQSDSLKRPVCRLC